MISRKRETTGTSIIHSTEMLLTYLQLYPKTNKRTPFIMAAKMKRWIL